MPVEPGRKVKGLRREEVAELADISFEYYLRLEQGRHRQPSPQVIECLARALLLDKHGAFYMHRLVRLQAGPGILGEPDPAVAENLRETLEMWDHTPAIVFTPNADVVSSNRLAKSLAGSSVEVGVNLVFMVFSDRCRAAAADWEAMARNCVANLRWRANPYDPHLQEIVGLLSLRDPDFRRIWAMHEAYPADLGVMTFRAPEHAEVNLRFQTFEIPSTPGWLLMVMRVDVGENRNPVTDAAQLKRLRYSD